MDDKQNNAAKGNMQNDIVLWKNTNFLSLTTFQIPRRNQNDES